MSAADPRASPPPHLAQKILRDRAALEGERRTVTVLSADAVGSTPMGERLDEEVLYTIMQGCFARMMDPVHRYEGTIAQFLGDGFLALFGAPIAHEDSARRAVAAALEMQQAIREYAAEVQQHHGVEVRFRVGLNTGPVVVGKIGDDLSMDYTAIGDTANLAARMQQLAEPGSVTLSEHTYRAIRDYIECAPLGPLTVKGKAAPVTAYQAVGVKGLRTRLEVAATRGLTPFIGRADELRVLRYYFAQALRGQGQVVFVSGEAGIGKSRLLLEFQRSVADEAITWLEGHCSSYSKNISYLPINEIIKQHFSVDAGDSDTAVVRRVNERTAGWDAAAQGTVPYLKYVLNVDPGDPAVMRMDPMERRVGVFDGLRALLLRESRRQPLVVVVEDLHWIDERSGEALAAVVDLVAMAPVLMILTYRPGYAPTLGERTYYSRLHLGHLPPAESVALAEAVLEGTTLPPQLQQFITRQAEGNPFYVEEFIRSLVEAGMLHKHNDSYTLARSIDQIRVPDTIQEIILSRIDRLEQPAKAIIQLASVIGREFTLRLLQRTVDHDANLAEALATLKTLDLIYQISYVPDPAYMFKHALTQEVAQSTLLVGRRKALHAQVAAAIEELYADRLPEHYERLAYHYSQGEEWTKALDYLMKAGDKAAAAYANQDALDFYARALAVCEKLGDAASATSIAVAQKHGFVNLGSGDLVGAIADFNRMLNTARGLGDRHHEGMALSYRGMAEFLAHMFQPAEETLRAALAVANEGFDDVRLSASVWLGMLLLSINRLPEATPLMQLVEELAPQVDDPFSRAWCGLLAGMAPNWAGRFDEALEILERWRAAAKVSVSTTLLSQWLEAVALGGKGAYQQALTLLEDMLVACARVGEVMVQARIPNTLGWIYGELQDHRRAMEWNMRGLKASQAINDPESESNARVNLGDNLLALGRLEEAEAQFQHTQHEQRQGTCIPQDRWALWLYRQHLFHSYGELWLARGNDDQAAVYAGECLQLAESTGRQKNIVKGRRLRGQALLAQSKPAEAEPEIANALEIAREIGNPPQLWKTLVALGNLRQAQGNLDEAQQAYREALAVIDTVAAGLTDTSLRDTFLNSAHVQAIRRLLQAVAHQPAVAADGQHDH